MKNIKERIFGPKGALDEYNTAICNLRTARGDGSSDRDIEWFESRVRITEEKVTGWLRAR